MGLIMASLTLQNPRHPELEPIQVEALADSGAVHLCVPEHVKVQLNLEEIEKKEAVIANGERVLAPYVGPVLLRFGNRSCFTGALVLGEKVLLGAIPMEDMDLVLLPKERKIIPNPDSPNYATATTM